MYASLKQRYQPVVEFDIVLPNNISYCLWCLFPHFQCYWIFELFCTQFVQGFSPPSQWNVVVICLLPDLIIIILMSFPTFFDLHEFSPHSIYLLLFFQKILIILDDICLCCCHFPYFKFCWFLPPNSSHAILTHTFWH